MVIDCKFYKEVKSDNFQALNDGDIYWKFD